MSWFYNKLVECSALLVVLLCISEGFDGLPFLMYFINSGILENLQYWGEVYSEEGL